ncbi:hypothetical protein PHLCEN_2v6439 [Hermanssonia centrifuga]|uniref:Uncharacterized protein n=1 Tax=Hermanssonia centrifuga TaxID=98765 RepID=A0A2R6P058_9APHY|nr:hypothetical protein PHLCEN_2v6439 [Hermanssonia centrifuga]
MAHSAARAVIAPRLRFSSYLVLRILIPLIAYIPISMSYTLVNVAFSLPLGGK